MRKVAIDTHNFKARTRDLVTPGSRHVRKTTLLRHCPMSARGAQLSLLLAVPAIIFFAISCAPHTTLQATGSVETETSARAKRYPDSRETEKLIYGEYMRWSGTQHRLGGTGQGGIDCSGFVRAVYKNLFNTELPRTTKTQVKQGTFVNRNELRAGDLVFFKPPTYPRHVGIFLKGKDFVHASKSKGVIISKIDPHYWGKYYWTARRILQNQ